MTQGQQLELQGVLGFERHEIGEHVHVTRTGVAVGIVTVKALVTQRNFGPWHQFDTVLLAGGRHLVMAGGGVVVGQRNRRNSQSVRFFC